MLKSPTKPSLSGFIKTCTPLAIIEPLETEMRQRVDSIAAALLTYQPGNDPVSNLAGFLRADRNFLGIVLSLINLSQEKFLRILTAQRFALGDFAPEWGIHQVQVKIQHQDGFAEQLAQLFLEGRESQTLVNQVAAFYLDQIALPDDWTRIIRDPLLVPNVIRNKLKGEYTDKKGDAIENIIRARLDSIRDTYGITHAKGQVAFLGKEVDRALPTISDPYVLIMSNYMETTSSSQTTRANEQSTLFLKIQEANIRFGKKRVFVNFVDGAGWLARRSDLRKMYDACDYIVNLKTLDSLEAIVCKHVPKEFFTVRPKPEFS